MPNFEVVSLFTCRKCGSPNKGAIQVEAADKSKALEQFHTQVKCAQCGVAPDQDQTMTIRTKALE